MSDEPVVPMVGPVIFEAMDGTPIRTATYTSHPKLRPAQIKYAGIWYYQNRQTPDAWVYRAVADAAGLITDTDPRVQLDG